MKRRAFIRTCMIGGLGVIGVSAFAVKQGQSDNPAPQLSTEGQTDVTRVTVNQSRCSGCRDCLWACESRAISIKNRTATIDQDLCNQCLSCVSACRRKAIEMS